MYRRSRRRKKRAAPLARSRDEKCVTKRCRNRKALKYTYYKSPVRGVIKYEGFLNHCWKCRARQLKERHPETYILNAIRSRARQRKLPFTITLAEFRQWCKETGYVENRGHGAGFATIDRIDHSKGYHIWNIQIMEFMENCTNGHVVPGKYLPQNYRKPETYDYDFKGPEPELQPVTENEPF